jgi:alpha-tubulin suppressor-like RCC1 family protein
VTAIETRKFKMVACNESHTLALTDEGNLFTWGSAAYGKLGPAVIEELKEKKYSLKDDKHTITLPPR